MLVRRTLPHRELRTVGAWCFLDDYGPADPHEWRAAAPAPMVVPPHPHTGLQTVTWLLSGEVLHQDSIGSEAVVRPGALNLMTAGRGIAHAETSTAASPVLRGVQLWVALPDAHRDTAPGFEHHPELPVFSDGGVTATVLLGSVGDARSPATTYTPIVGADVSVRPGQGGRLPLEPAWEHAVLALTHGVTLNEGALPLGSLAYLGCGRDGLTVSAAGDAPARALLLGGAPFEEQLLMWWNFVGRDQQEITAARDEWMAVVADGSAAGRSPDAAGSGRFGPVLAYDGAPLPAPTLPGVRLRPR